MFPWMCALYIAVNYFLFFAPSKVVPKNDLFAYLSIFGLPVMFVVFLLIGKNKNSLYESGRRSGATRRILQRAMTT